MKRKQRLTSLIILGIFIGLIIPVITKNVAECPTACGGDESDVQRSWTGL